MLQSLLAGTLNWTDLIKVEFYTPGGRALSDDIIISGNSSPGEWQIVANYQSQNPLAGWSYLWNSNFDGSLGKLTPGDTIYAGADPDGHDGCDGFVWNYSIGQRQRICTKKPPE